MMKTFVLKTTVGLFFILICLHLLSQAGTKFWGNEILLDKLNYLETSTDSTFDTYFIGSSRVNLQIDTKLFDKATQQTSFNLGCPALSGIETMRLAESLIKQKKRGKHPTTHLFIEMPLIDFHKGKNDQTTRGSYFFNFEAFYQCTQFLRNEELPFEVKLKQFGFHLKTAIGNQLKLGTFKDLLTTVNKEVPISKTQRFNQMRGYRPLIIGQETDGDLKRRKDFLKDTTQLTMRLNDAGTYIARKKNLAPLNSYLLESLTQLIEEGKENGIEVIVLLFPKSNGIIYKKTAKVFNSLPLVNKINLAKPGKYRDFYHAKFSYDKAHLNKAGSTQLTKSLATEFLNIKTSQR